MLRRINTISNMYHNIEYSMDRRGGMQYGTVSPRCCRSPGQQEDVLIIRSLCLSAFTYTARFEFGANVVIQVLFYRLSFLIRQIIRKECNSN